jgi:hypothetical protein
MNLNQPNRPILRDLALLAFAAALGWWAHGANTAVSADTLARYPDELAFQFGGTGLEGSLTLYSPSDHKLYVYPAAAGNAHISCAYSLKLDRAGMPIERTNCGPGSLY